MSLFPIVLSSLLLASSVPSLPVDEVAEPSAGVGALEGESGPPREAVEAFQRGRTLYANAQYEEALAAFQRADRLHPAADLQYNIALCHMRLENWSEAIAGFEIYLRTKGDPQDRADVEARIAEARRRGEYEQSKAQLSTPVVAAPPPELEAPPEPIEVQTDESSSPKPWIGLVATGSVLLGVGGAWAIGGGTGFGVAVARKNDEVEAIVDGGNPRGVGYAEAQQLEADAKRLRTAQWVTVGLGSGVAVTGAVLLGFGLKRRGEARRNAIAVRPLVAPRARGVAIGGSF
jgi:tetratricopeptide (TPR) repeat protein